MDADSAVCSLSAIVAEGAAVKCISRSSCEDSIRPTAADCWCHMETLDLSLSIG